MTTISPPKKTPSFEQQFHAISYWNAPVLDKCGKIGASASYLFFVYDARDLIFKSYDYIVETGFEQVS